MDRLTLLETFATALDEGSLNKAAQRRGISQSAVSQQIKRLEALLGHQLLHRNASGVQPTRAGELVFANAQGLLSGYTRFLAELNALDEQVTGTFRLSAGNFLGRAVIGPMLIDLNADYPDLNIVMKLEDRLVDVVRENFDLAIRTGRLGDTDGVGRKITTLQTVLFATPAYLDNVGRPSAPEDLKRLKFIQHHEDQTKGFFPLHRDGEEVQAPIQVGFTADDPDLIMHAVNSGTGYTRAPLILVDAGLKDGTYEQLLPEYDAPDKDVFAVYPSRHTSGRAHEVIIAGFLDRLAQLRQASRPRPPALRAISA